MAEQTETTTILTTGTTAPAPNVEGGAPASPAPPAPAPPPQPGTPPGTETPAGKAPEPAPDYSALKFAEGFKVDEELLGEAKTAFAEAKLPAEQAQKYLDLSAKLVDRTIAAITDAHRERIAEWGAATKADPGIGGDKLEATKGQAAKALDAFGTLELKQALNESGLGNHPAMVRFCAAVGRELAEDKLLASSRPAKPNGPLAFYDKTPGMRE